MGRLLTTFSRVMLVVILLYCAMLGLLYSSVISVGKKPSCSIAGCEYDDEVRASVAQTSRRLPSADDAAAAHKKELKSSPQLADPSAAAAAPVSETLAPVRTDNSSVIATGTAAAAASYSDVLLLKPQQKNGYFSTATSIWRDDATESDDRILGQMRYRPASASRPSNAKLILVPTGLAGAREGRNEFIDNNCPVTECELTDDLNRHGDAHVVLWRNEFWTPADPRPRGQIWAVFFLESPYNTPSLDGARGLINWTSTYRHDSTVVAPYERFTQFAQFNVSVPALPYARNYAAGKTKKVAWFVSNCAAMNNRLGYAQELGKHIAVDIYGECGPLQCQRDHTDDCFKRLSQDYKFYLSFENSNCRDYITEKFFVNGLTNDILPVVMGAHPDDYERAAPYHSYIHVDDFDSPAALAARLLQLDGDDDQYNAYFAWKGTGANINTYYWCRLCAMAHAADGHAPVWYDDIEQWWRGTEICTPFAQAGELWPRWKR